MSIIKIRISPTIANDYCSRAVFGGDEEWPYVPEDPGVHSLPVDTVRAVRDDAEFNGNVRGDGPDEMPPGIRRAYAALYHQCVKALEGAA